MGTPLRDSLADLHITLRDWEQMTAEPQPPPADRLRPLAEVVRRLDDAKPAKVVQCPPNYVADWDQFTKGELAQVTPRAVRALCWEPNVVVQQKFAATVAALDPLLPRQIQGLVYSLHLAWSKSVATSWTRQVTETAIVNYRGKHRLIRLWQHRSGEVISAGAPDSLANTAVSNLAPLEACFDELRIDPASLFAQTCVGSAAVTARNSWATHSERLNYALAELLPWEHWEIGTFKREIGAVILDDVFRIADLQDRLKSTLLTDRRLGDLRLPHRRPFWAMVDPAAQRRVVEWLSRADIVFFFEHALPSRFDPHRRKDFWLRYVTRIQQSRPLLNYDDRARLRAVLADKAGDMMNIGHIDEASSAFILGFGDIWVVEFSRKGNACFVYDAAEFRKIIRDIWTTEAFRNAVLKNPGRCLRRIVHREGWQSEMANLLARAGVRPT